MHVVLISCVAGKKSGAHKAEDLYDSPLFFGQLNYAKKLNPDRIYILSAKHGLVPLSKKIEKYNETLNDATAEQKQAWGDRVVKQLKQQGIDIEKCRFTSLAGAAYMDGIEGKIKIDSEPLKGKGLGQRLEWLKKKVSLEPQEE